jgi:hypothetical protein
MKDSVWVNLLVGIWLFVAAFFVTPAAMTRSWNDIIMATILLLSSGWAINGLRPVGSLWIEIITGLWLIVAPFALHYGPLDARAGTWSDLISGIVVAAVALMAWVDVRRPTRLV